MGEEILRGVQRAVDRIVTPSPTLSTGPHIGYFSSWIAGTEKDIKWRVDRLQVKQKRKIVCLVVGLSLLLVSGATNAYALPSVIQDFESYADTAALNADISYQTGNATVTLNTSDSMTPGSQCLEFIGADGSSPYYAKAELEVPLTSLWNVPRVDIWFKSLGPSSEILKFQLKDEYGGTLVTSQEYTGGTKDYTDWTCFSIDTSGTTSGMTKVAIITKPGNYGTGGVLIDNITIVPEPATFGLVGLGAVVLLAFRRR